MNGNKEIVNVRVDEILPNRFQPRLTFNEEEIKDLAESIKMHGVIQPLVLRKLGDKYEIIAGERRFKASTLAGLQTVPAIIVEMDDKESAEVALVENLQRKDLTAIEEAQSYKKILDMGYLTQEELATRMGVSQPNIANKLRLLNLAIPVKEALLANKISERHARSLLNITDSNSQIAMLNRIINERLTVRQTDDEINKLLGRSVFIDEKPLDVNINEVKETSQNLINEHKPSDLDLLLKSQDDIVKVETPQVTETPVNSFDMPQMAETPVVDNVNSNIFENPLDTNPVIEETKLESLDNNITGVNEMPINPFMNEEFTDFSKPYVPETPANSFDMPQMAETPIANETPVINKEPELDIMDLYEKMPEFSAETPAANETPAPAPVVEETEDSSGSKVLKAISTTRDTVTNLKNMGYTVDTEEFDFNDTYQIIIKIKKD